jgi:glucokinase
VHGDSGRVVNAGWRFSARAVAVACGLDSVTLVNDFAALAAAVPTCAPTDLDSIDRGSPLDGSPVSVVGPGTGFGVALLVPGTPRWSVVATEGGHAGFAPAGTPEQELLAFLRRDRPVVEIEQLLSGRGLLNIHGYLCARDGLAPEAGTPAAISRAALDGSDARCTEAARWFLDILADIAGDVALLHGATGGVYFGGGVLDHLRPLLDPQRFRTRFAAKGALGDYLEGIPLYAIRREHAALHGAAYLYREA